MIFKILMSINIALTALYSYWAIPFGWDKWMNSQNYAAGQFGHFLVFSPLVVFLILTVVVISIAPKEKKRDYEL